MGCGPSRSTLISELNKIIAQITKENAELEAERDNLKLQQELRQDDVLEEKDSVGILNSLSLSLEKQIIEAKHIGVVFLPPHVPDHELYKNINIVVKTQQKIEEKCEVLQNLKIEVKSLNKEKESVELEIAELEIKMIEFESSISSNDKQNNIEKFYYKEKIRQLAETKSALVKEIQDSENSCKALSDEIFTYEGEYKDSTDAPTYEYLLTLTENDIRKETIKVEAEIEELTSHLRNLKQKELEIEQMNEYIMNVQHKPPTKIEILRKQVEESKNKAMALSKEKEKIKEEILILKKNSQSNGIDQKMQKVNEILEKNKEKVAEKTEKPSNSSWKNEIVETLQKSKNMMNSFKFKN